MKRKYLSLIAIAGISASISVLPGCTKQEGCTDPTAANYDSEAEEDDGSCQGAAIVLSGNETWSANEVHVLAGRVVVPSGVTLTIEPGAVIKGEPGTGANASALLVAPGGRLVADGTPSLPIIFTSTADDITPADVAAGNFASPNLEPTVNGLWGGVIILGNAPISASAAQVAIEGLPTTDPNGLYGGSIPADDSGILRYVSIRHGGSNIGAGNEINGLTLGGVGTGTIISNIEIVSNQDDGVEWFGGTVNVDNVVVWNVGDDALDTDQSWDGTVNNFVIIHPTGHCFELDGPEGTMEAGHTISNGVVYASGAGRVSEDLINTDENSIVDLENILITGIESGQQVNRVEHPEGTVNFTSILLDVDPMNLSDYFPEGATVPAGFSAGNTVPAGVDLNVFDWTWAKEAQAF